MATTATWDLHALHLQAMEHGLRTRVLAAGDAEELLWSAPRARVLRGRWQCPGVMASELHALLDADGQPLAWWQRSAAAAWTGEPVAPPVPHVTLHEIACAAAGLGVAGRDARVRCIDAFRRTLATVAGVAPGSFRHPASLEAGCRCIAVAPAHPHTAGARHPLSLTV